MLSTADVLKVLSKDKSLGLFGIAATTTGSDTDSIISKTKFTPKQCYFRMSKLMNAGFIKRKNGKYRITALGKVVYNTQMKTENAVNNYWKLKAIDSLEQSHDRYTEEERKKLIDNLIDNQEIKDILVPDKANNENEFESDQRFIVCNRQSKT